MASIGTLPRVALLVWLCGIIGADKHDLPALCSVDQGTRVMCSCQGDQNLELAAIAHWLPTATTELKVTDCRHAAVEVKGSGAVFSSAYLQRMAFGDIKKLTFYKDGLDLNLAHEGVFILDIQRLETLQFTRGSIRLSGAPSAILLRDVSVPQLPQYAIVASSLRLLQMTGLTLLNGALPFAVNVGSTGAVLHMEEVDTGKGLYTAWVTGQVEGITLVRCRLTLHYGAFSKVSLSKTNLLKTILIQENVFQLKKDARSLILPTDLIELTTSETILVSISANIVQCRKETPFNMPASKISYAFYNTSRCSDPSLVMSPPQYMPGEKGNKKLLGSLNTATMDHQTGEYVISVG